ncbi:MAG TPA: aromatic ring-hydroxylating dioxygenase subunit alpha [Acidimicrobiales bacterium]|nr:aromatic ring-hydroxylating dioxygenase subunit alpha [Acidimicrobiales bacterium]
MIPPITNTHPALRRCWLPLARASELGEQPARFMLLDQPLVAFRSPADGQVRVYPDRCPHRGAPLSIGCAEGGGIRCAYHGWRFGPDGRCDEIPALGPNPSGIPPKAHLTPVAGTAERYGMVFVALDEPLPGVGLPEVPEADNPRFAMGELPILSARASVGLLADNFLDTAHFPFVHAATFGASEEREVGRFEVTREPGELAFTATYQHQFANREDPAVARGERPLLQTRRLTYRLVAPFHLTLRIEFLEAGGTNTIGFFLQPETAEACRIMSAIWRDDLDGDAERLREAVEFEVKVVEEDLRVQEAYHRLELPLDPTAEVHTRADRTTIELRRVLSDLVAASSK